MKIKAYFFAQIVFGIIFFVIFGFWLKAHCAINCNNMNKRELKKSVNYICSELFAEGVAASLYSQNADKDNINALLASIINIQNDFVRRISHPEPGMPAKVFYKQLIKDFNNTVSEVIDQIAHLQ